VKTCFVAAPAGTPLGVLSSTLKSRDIRILVPEDLTAGTDWSAEVLKEIAKADLVIGVLPPRGWSSPWVLFELGQASALGRQLILIVPPDSEPLPFSLQRMLVIRADLNNAEAIGFALDQVLSAPTHSRKETSGTRKTLSTLGDEVDVLLTDAESAIERRDGRSLEQIVARAIRGAGADIIVASPTSDKGADLAVWSDVLESSVGNPLLVEVKLLLENDASANRAMLKVATFLSATNSQWGLLLYAKGPDQASPVWKSAPYNVLALPLDSFLKSLRERAFPEVIRDLRNRRVHDVDP
jgi:TIR domain-containing protein